jgi:glycosyltransferase involved in cell wall biosynthesis
MKKTRLLFLVTEDWYFVSHRLALAAEAKNAGYDVSVATRELKHGGKIRELGVRVIPFQMSRRGGNPVSEILRLIKLFKKERPDIVHLVALKPVIYGGIACRIVGVPHSIGAVAGLGWLFTNSGRLQRWIQPIFRKILALLLSSPRFTTIVQNPDDFQFLLAGGVHKDRIQMVRGSGVDVNVYTPANASPPPPLTVILVARMLWDKGIGEFVEAARILKPQFDGVRFVLVGDPDPANPAAIPISKLNEWNGQNGIEWLGRQDEVGSFLQQAHIACLPSYREGLPKSLLEALAVGLPVVTTDAPGCREVVRPGFNGLLVPVKDSGALARALAQLLSDEKLRAQMGENSRQLAISDFSESIINRQVLDLYRKVLS